MNVNENGYWDVVAKDLAVRISKNVEIAVSKNDVVHTDFLVHDFGAANGMLIFHNAEQLDRFGNRLIELGYGYSVIGLSSADRYDRETSISMFEDWGWSGAINETPAWMGLEN